MDGQVEGIMPPPSIIMGRRITGEVLFFAFKYNTAFSRLMRSRVYNSWASVRLSVCPIDRQQQRRLAGMLLSALRAGDIGAVLQAPALQQQMRVARNAERPNTYLLYRNFQVFNVIFSMSTFHV